MQILTIAIFAIFAYGSTDEEYRHICLFCHAAGLRQRLFVIAQIVRRAYGRNGEDAIEFSRVRGDA